MKSKLCFLFALLIVGCLCQISQNRGPRMSNTFRFSTYTRQAKVHIFQSTKSSVIVAPSLPVRFNDINYYWYGNYVFDDSHPLKCEYDIDESDHELVTVVHKDGSKPQSLQYGCLNYEQCCGLECCGDIRTSTVTMCLASVTPAHHSALGLSALSSYILFTLKVVFLYACESIPMTYTLLFLFALSVVSIKTQTIEDEYQELPSNSTDNASSYDIIVKKFVKQNSIKAGVITSPYLQIRYKNINYYWLGYYSYNSNDSMRCEYPIEESDSEFRGVTYPDGTKPSALSFRCQKNESCCGLECCSESRSSIFIVGAIILFFVGLYWIIIKYRKYGKQKREAANNDTSQPLRNPKV
ncbi:hypothetical protein B9Z55_020112 [Caenorhabditis nigoni]|nr:hypothetical protein B9Z55_020112 [Caenorhabditis nigoni]